MNWLDRARDFHIDTKPTKIRKKRKQVGKVDLGTAHVHLEYTRPLLVKERNVSYKCAPKFALAAKGRQPLEN